MRSGPFLLAALLIAGGASAQPLESSDPCAASSDCRKAGECTSRDGECVVASDFDCTGAEVCRDRGRCSAVAGECVATTEADCRTSSHCQTAGKCFFDREDGECDDGMENTSTPLMIGGIVVAGLGALATAAGGALSALYYVGCRNFPPYDEAESCVPTPWLIMMGAGAGAAIAIGLPMILVGGRDVPRDDQRAAPSLILGPGAAAVRVPF